MTMIESLLVSWILLNPVFNTYTFTAQLEGDYCITVSGGSDLYLIVDGDTTTVNRFKTECVRVEPNQVVTVSVVNGANRFKKVFLPSTATNLVYKTFKLTNDKVVVDCEYCELQYSEDGFNFETISTVVGQYEEPINYVLDSYTYYRLKNGDSYSSILRSDKATLQNIFSNYVLYGKEKIYIYNKKKYMIR